MATNVAIRQPRTSCRMLTLDGVAKYLNVTRRTVQRYVKAGLIPAPRRIGGSVRWDKRALDEWASDGCKPVHSEGQAAGGATGE
jgi:excisionase family DNA binding protein